MANKITWRLEHERVRRLLLHYAMPAVIGTMVNALYNIVDHIFIGQECWSAGNGRIDADIPYSVVPPSVWNAHRGGAATRVSIYLGRRENEMAEKVLGECFHLDIHHNACDSSSLHDLDERFITGFRGKRTDHPVCTGLSEYRGSGTLLTSLSFGFNAVMRASGYPKKAMFTMLIGAITNVILDPIFIFWLDMGIKGGCHCDDHLDAALYSFCHEPFCPKRQYRPFP